MGCRLPRSGHFKVVSRQICNNSDVEPEMQTKTKDVKLNPLMNIWHFVVGFLRDKKTTTVLSNSMVLSDTGDDDFNDESRGHWGKKLDFLLSCVGFAVGLGNIWRFPFKVLQNGGASFLIAYLTMLTIMALPLFLVELTLGQFTSRGVTECWHFVPGLKGMGYIMLIMSLFCSLYYNTVIAWTLYYTVMSLSPSLPWLSCNNYWNDELCRSSSFSGIFNHNDSHGSFYEMSTEQFFERNVITRIYRDGNGQTLVRTLSEPPGIITWYTGLCLIAAWILNGLVLMFGVKVSGKSMYFLTTYPYLVLTVIIICGATLQGSGQGIKFFLIPQWGKLATFKIWSAAAEQIFFSLGIGFGSMLTFGSYNTFHANLQQDVLVIGAINSFTSLFGGFAVFELLGFMAYRYNKTVIDMSKYAGSGLIFTAYPEGFSQFKGNNVLCLLFFTMILCLGFDSQLGMMETVITGILDKFPVLRSTTIKRVTFVIVLHIVCCLFSLIFVTQTGYYWFTIMSYYSVATNLLMVGFFESVIVSYVYGINNFSRDFKMMLGHPLNIVWKICLLGPVPIITIVLTVYSFMSYTPTTIGSGYNKVVFPMWADLLGWIIFLISLLPLPIYFVYFIINAFRNKKEKSVCTVLKSSIVPDMYYGPGTKVQWLKNEFYKNKYKTFRKNEHFKKSLMLPVSNPIIEAEETEKSIPKTELSAQSSAVSESKLSYSNEESS